jgi:hypothetical protein
MLSLNDVENLTCGNVMLEPRLQEYLKKKQLYKKNNISCISLEQEYMIMPEDIKRIQAFYEGDRNIYDHDKQDTYLNLVEPQKYFPSDSYKQKDVRMENIKNRQLDHVRANEQRKNFNSFTDKDQKITPYADPPYNKPSGLDLENYLNSPETNLKNNYKHSRVYHDQPKIEYKTRLPYEQGNCPTTNLHNHTHHDKKVHDIIGSLDSYGNTSAMGQANWQNHERDLNNTQNAPYQRQSEMDTDTKVMIPNTNAHSSEKKNLNWTKYRPVPYMGQGEGNKDIDAENEMILGMPTRTVKSYGFKNPVEHHFDYITHDIQTPNHTVMPFPRGGFSTREMNHQTSRPQSRDIY